MILLIDNYDSFTWNLVHYLMELGAQVDVVRNDALTAAEAVSSGAKAFLLSPGPCTPNEAGISLDLVAACADAGKPLLGVCLGHQSIGQHFGGKVVRGGLMHGKTSPVTHDGSGLLPFKPSLFAALVPPPAGMLVQPVYLSYGHHTPRVAWIGDEKVTENFWRLLSYLTPVTATLHFLEPFDPLHYPDRKAISAEVRARIGAAMEGGGNAARLV